MKIKHIELKQFRNYDTLQLPLSNDLLFFLGNNAQGKTNLLEAIYYASTTRSFRSSSDIEMIQFDKNFAKIDIDLQRESDLSLLSLIINKEGKYITKDLNPVKKISSMVGYLNAVMFCPSDMKVLFSSPKDRRKFIDIELGKISTKYMNDLVVFQKLLKERNAYLKETKFDEVYWSTLNERFIEVEVDIILARYTFMELLEKFASYIYQYLSNEKEPLHLIYKSCIEVTNKEDMKRELLSKYEKVFAKEREYMMTLHGCHREDFEIFLGDMDVSLYGSQGQKRSAILSLKIGLLEVIRKKIGEYPILLLDDVLSELDEKRRIALFQIIPKEVQTFITSTELSSREREYLPHCCIYTVEKGSIIKEESL
ncbi:MAG: DNA replication/repair protein RecF [Erysipelotrichales bacterium]|nr:DNA replication/repair protein RecF [Erysipelotrichales bacterium]